MAYTITLTNGTVLTTIANTTVDNTTSLTLIGQNYSGYGQYIANDLVHVLENFSNVTPPATPLTGQLWYDSTTQFINVYNGTAWVQVGFNLNAGGDLTGTYPNPTIKASVGLTGVPTAPTASPGTNTTQIATTAFVEVVAAAVVAVGSQAVGGDLTGAMPDPTINASVGLTGVPTAPTAAFGTSTTQIATTSFVQSAARPKLIANTTFYVGYPGGSDTNQSNGWGMTTGTSFVTLTAAYTRVVDDYDCQGFNVTFQLNDGTYPSTLIYGYLLAASSVSIVGDVGTPANVVIAGINAFGIRFFECGQIFLGGITISATGTAGQYTYQGIGLVADTGSYITLTSPIIFAASGYTQLAAYNGGLFETVGVAYTITGGTNAHMSAVNANIITVDSTITITGTPAFATAFATSSGSGANLIVYSTTFVGSATGVRWIVQQNGVVNTLGAGGSYLPGSSAGESLTGGQYI